MGTRIGSRIPPSAAPPPKKEAPDRIASAGADNGLTGTGHAKFKSDSNLEQAWQRGLPESLVALICRHRQARPGEPLPILVQRAVAAVWVRL